MAASCLGRLSPILNQETCESGIHRLTIGEMGVIHEARGPTGWAVAHLTIFSQPLHAKSLGLDECYVGALRLLRS